MKHEQMIEDILSQPALNVGVSDAQNLFARLNYMKGWLLQMAQQSADVRWLIEQRHRAIKQGS